MEDYRGYHDQNYPYSGGGYSGFGNVNGIGSYSGSGNGAGFGTGFGTGPNIGIPTQTITKSRFSWLFLIFSILAAALFFIIGEFIYTTLIRNVHSILFMGIYFAAFGFILWFLLFLAARIQRLKFSIKSIFIPLLCMALLLGGGILFEFLYETNFIPVKSTAESYIFALDNSSSMEVSDPGQKRIAAVEQILDKKGSNFNFAVYTFGEQTDCIRQMAPLSEGIGDLTVQPSGGTPIVGVLEVMMYHMETGTLTYDSGTQVILLTDGYSTDIDENGQRRRDIIRKFKDKGISISTVGFGNVDEAYLSEISRETGGLSVTTDRVDQLESAMTSVIRTQSADRDLLSIRKQQNMNWFYALLRIVFLFILGIFLIGIKLSVTDASANAKKIIMTSLIFSILAALAVEFGLCFILNGFLARLILVLFFSLMITNLERIIDLGVRLGNLSRLG